MIIDPPTAWWRLLLSYRGSVLPRIYRRLGFTVVFAIGVTWLNERGGSPMVSLTATPFSLVGLALSIFLGFRNNTSYDRFWEGRKLWGALINASRTLARQLHTLVDAPPDDAERRRQIHRAIAYVHALRHRLRGSDARPELRERLGAADADAVAGLANIPVGVLRLIGADVSGAWRRGQIHPQHVPVLEATLAELTSIQGGCERIKATPIPFSYNVLLHRLVATYCLALPFGLVQSIHWLTPAVVALVAYAFLGLDALGEEIEEPFGDDANDLPLDALCRIIEIDLLDAAGEPHTLTPWPAVRGQLT